MNRPLRQAHELPGHLLRRCHQISVALFFARCRGFDLTPLQYIALAALEERGPLDQVSLGGLAALDRTTISVVIKKLEERGLVVRRRSDEDRRSIIVEITEPGVRLRREVEPAVLKAQAETVAPLDPAERAELVRLLSKLAEGNNEKSRAPARPTVSF